MTSHTIQLTTGTRSWTSQELATLNFQLGSSGSTWLKTDSCVVKRLDAKGRLAIVQIDHWQPGNALHTLYEWDSCLARRSGSDYLSRAPASGAP